MCGVNLHYVAFDTEVKRTKKIDKNQQSEGREKPNTSVGDIEQIKDEEMEI